MASIMFEEKDTSPVGLMFTPDRIYIELDRPLNAENDHKEHYLLLEIMYHWIDRLNISMSARNNLTWEYDLEPMNITDYQTAVDNLHDIMEMHPGRISAQQETALLEKWDTYFKGLENAVFFHAEKEGIKAACEYCLDDEPDFRSLSFEFSYFPAVPQSPLNKESITVQQYTMCPTCGNIAGIEVVGEFHSFAYDALEMIDDIVAKEPFDYEDATPLKEAAEFIRNKTTY